MRLKSASIVIAFFALASAAVVTAAPTSHDALAGIWSLNRDKSVQPGGGYTGDADNGDRDRQGGGQRRGGGGGGGLGGGGQRGSGRRDGGQQGAQGRDPEQIQAMAAYTRRLLQPSAGLAVVVHDTSVSLTDAEGRVQTLDTSNKKSDERAENGLVKLTRKSHWDAGTLVSDVDLDNGAKIERRYEVSEGGSELRVLTKISGRGGDRTLTFVYERPLQ
jgi:hypothetical protein